MLEFTNVTIYLYLKKSPKYFVRSCDECPEPSNGGEVFTITNASERFRTFRRL